MSCPSSCPYLCYNNSIHNLTLNCNLGDCAADEKLDLGVCRFKHDEYTMYIKQSITDINIQKNTDYTLYFNFPTSRFAFYTLFQELPFDKITAQDIQIEVELLAYHRSNHNITLFQNNLEILKNMGTQAILPLMNNFYFTIYLALVCDTDLQKRKII